jgi:predicted nucleic acid-binding protein
MIHAWDNYPERQFPPLWNWIAREIGARRIAMPRVACDEVAGKTPECADWLRAKDIVEHEVTNAITQQAMGIKGLLGIVGDNYHPKGVGENDIIIISTALVHGVELVSEEQRQPNPPQLAVKRKIHLVCAMPEVAVRCWNFIEYIRGTNEVFG